MMNKIQYNLKLAVLLSSLFWAFSASVQADSEKFFNATTGHTYQRFDTYKTWTNAQAACVAQGGYLATLTSQAENDWLKIVLTNATDDIWIGASGGITTGQWQWVTGETWSYTNLASGGFLELDYLSIPYHASSGSNKWKASSYSSLLYICEWDKAFKTTTSMITADTDNNGSTEFVLVGYSGATVKVFGYDRVSKAVVSNVSFLPYPAYSGVSLSVVDDMNSNGSKEFALLMTKAADGSSVIQTRDSKTGVLIETFNVPR